ncbi:hypothetical protein QBC34DRAFT_410934 [Podospora aff. communis PSN243]|uniref:Chitin synthase export chaperone n=1 Tax=Podospora aff. communis PSN243 TaxID=3040156 RepID=A0AAV9GG68_9PEZI|nr:hypothetical protein QBC34DRAFT_410934 [Podospora aff. communis PSN243]
MPVSGVQMGYPVSFRILANCLILGTSLVFWNLSLRKHSLPRCVLQATYFGFIGLVGSIALFTCGLDDLSSSWTYLYTPSPGILKARTALSIFLGLGGLYGVFGALFVFGPRMKPS